MYYDELDTYNGDTEHDMWVDFTYHENTGELTDEFGDEDLDDGFLGDDCFDNYDNDFYNDLDENVW